MNERRHGNLVPIPSFETTGMASLLLGTTALVDYSQGREDDAEDDADDGHGLKLFSKLWEKGIV